MIPGSASQFFLGASQAAGGAGGLQVSRSLRFNSADSAYLNRTPSVAGSRTTWTWSGWVKRSKLGARYSLFAAGADGTEFFFEQSTSADKLHFYYFNGSYQGQCLTTALFRDPSAWYHIVLAVDTTQGTASNRCKIYVNGSEQATTFLTNFGSSANLDINNTVSHKVGGGNGGGALTFDGYLANIHFIDGQALTPASFAETDATTGAWNPKAYTGTYGTNGFYLQFADNSSNTASTLGKDTSGNGNNWTPNNFSVSTGGPTSVASASGALPVWNTTDTYGTTKGTGTRTDSNSSSIVLALPIEGANNGTTFTDESATIRGSGSAKSITRYGDAKTSTAQSKFYGSSGYFDGNGDYIEISDSADFSLGSGDFTIEVWVNPVALVSDRQASIFGQWSNQNDRSWDICCENTGASLKVYGVSLTSYAFNTSLPIGQWTHLALVRGGNTLKAFSNGLQIGTTTISEAIVDSPQSVKLGTNSDSFSQRYFNGYIQDARLYKGVAKYTGNFNPPSSTANATIAAGNDSLVDSPTNYGTDTGVGGEVRGNYCVGNWLNQSYLDILKDGNLQWRVDNIRVVTGTIAMSSGKWYWEATIDAIVSSIEVGIVGTGIVFSAAPDSNASPGIYSSGYVYKSNANKVNNNSSSSYGASFSAGDTIGIAFDSVAGTLTFYKNGASQGTAFTGIPAGSYVPTVYGSIGGGNTGAFFNFGQRAFAYQSVGSNRPASDFKCLCTQNLPEGTITTSGTYTGNGVADGPFVYLNGVPTAMTVGINAVTFGTNADKLSNGFKLRTTNVLYNQNALSYSYSITTTGAKFKYARAQPNP